MSAKSIHAIDAHTCTDCTLANPSLTSSKPSFTVLFFVSPATFSSSTTLSLGTNLFSPRVPFVGNEVNMIGEST